MIDADTERNLAIRAKQGDRAAAEKLLLAHDGFFVHMARSFGFTRHDMYDAAQQARLSAFIALQEFDPDRGYRFLTFAGRKIRWDLQRMRQQDGLIRLPNRQNLGVGHSAEKEQLARKARHIGSFDDLVAGAFRLVDNLASRDDLAVDIDRDEEIYRLRDAISQLDPRERVVMRLRLAGQNYREIAKRIGLSHERARQLYNKGRVQVEWTLTRRGMVAA